MATRTFQGVTQHERAADRRARLLEAALEVIGERGVHDFTMTAVCRAAGLTERYFYESFARREDLLGALFDTVAATALDHATRAADAVDRGDHGEDGELRARARAAIGATTALLAADPRAARLYREAIGHPELAARRQDTVTAFAAFLARLVSDAHPALDRTGDDLVVDTVVLTGGIVDVVGLWLDDRLPVEVDAVVDRCAGLVVTAARQLCTEVPTTDRERR